MSHPSFKVEIIQFVDLCGHEKYLKTTIFGLVGLCPDYAFVVVNANAGLQRMTRVALITDCLRNSLKYEGCEKKKILV